MNARLLTAVIVLPVFLAALFWLPRAGWAFFLLPWLLAGAWEWGALARWAVRQRVAYLLVFAAAAGAMWITMAVPPDRFASLAVYAGATGFWLLVAPLWLWRGWRVTRPFAMAMAGLVVLLPLWLALVELQSQPYLLLSTLAILWISDTVAFLSGKRWGRHKLAPSISPGKTWEGVAGAFVAVTLYYVILDFASNSGFTIFHGLSGWGFFLLLAALGVEGDLFESWIKRTAGVKDSGTILPGHGGVLDRVDALASSMPAAALLATVFR